MRYKIIPRLMEADQLLQFGRFTYTTIFIMHEISAGTTPHPSSFKSPWANYRTNVPMLPKLAISYEFAIIFVVYTNI